MAGFHKLRPFADRPDIEVEVLFWPVSLDTETLPYPNPFVLRNWDRLERQPQTTIGTVQDYVVYYTGPLPSRPIGHICGLREEWYQGLLYSTYLAGGYTCDCPEVILPDYVSSVTCDDSSIDVVPNTGDVVIHLNMAFSCAWAADQAFGANVTIDVSPLPTFLGFTIVGDLGAGAVNILEVWSNGFTRISNQLSIGASHTATTNRLEIAIATGQTGIKIRPTSGSPVTGPFLECERGGASVQFRVDYDGSLWTNQTFAATTPGSIVAAMPIYDASGAIVGYLPIYDSIT